MAVHSGQKPATSAMRDVRHNQEEKKVADKFLTNKKYEKETDEKDN